MGEANGQKIGLHVGGWVDNGGLERERRIHNHIVREGGTEGPPRIHKLHVHCLTSTCQGYGCRRGGVDSRR